MKEKKKVIDEECYWHSLASVGAEGHKCREEEKAHWEKQVVQQDSYQNMFSKTRTLGLSKGSHGPLRLMKSPVTGVI